MRDKGVRIFTIYKIVNLINGKVYIGTTSATLMERLIAHMQCLKRGKNLPLYEEMRLYGIENFYLQELENVKCDKVRDANYYERFWIKEYNSIIPNGYNKYNNAMVRQDSYEFSRKVFNHVRSNKISVQDFADNLKVSTGYYYCLINNKVVLTEQRRVQINNFLGTDF